MKQELTLFDSICIIIGIIVGVGIYESAPLVAAQFDSWHGVLGIWLLGGILSLAGALCYAELATAYPKDGGEFVYLDRAYGELLGWLYAWSRILVIRPGSIASMAFPFATYLLVVWEMPQALVFGLPAKEALAILAVFGITLVNSFDLGKSKWSQNVLTTAKTIGLLAIVFVPFFLTETKLLTSGGAQVASSSGSFGLALILVLFTYGGWSDIAFVAAEVREPKRTLIRSLIGGTAAVTVIYLLVNYSFLATLGHEAASGSSAIAVDTAARVLPGSASILVSLLICISALGAVNGLVVTGSRVSYAFGVEHSAFQKLAEINRSGVPLVALWLQALISIFIIVLAGSFQAVLVYTTAVVWLFYFLTGLGVAVLRRKEPNTERPFLIPFYPLPVLVFCGTSAYLTYSAFVYDMNGTLVSIGLLLSGLPVYYFTKKLKNT